MVSEQYIHFLSKYFGIHRAEAEPRASVEDTLRTVSLSVCPESFPEAFSRGRGYGLSFYHLRPFQKSNLAFRECEFGKGGSGLLLPFEPRELLKLEPEAKLDRSGIVSLAAYHTE